jgi:hypothetical protein
MLDQKHPSFFIVGYIIKPQAILLITIMNNNGEVHQLLPIKELVILAVMQQVPAGG